MNLVMRELDRFLLMRLVERFVLVVLLLFCMFAAADYAFADTPLPQAPHSTLAAMGPQVAHICLALSPAIPARPGLPR